MSLLQWVHLTGFGFAFLGCFLACWRTRLITHAETRHGLYALFVTSGLWAGAYLVTFLTSSLALATAAYQVGLICGISTVFAWLYFCSAYTGETYHREPGYRRGALVLLIAIVAVKLTNPFHGRYFAIEMVEMPFSHASITLLGIHWAVTVLAYALAAVGIYMLLQLFQDSHVQTTGITLLVGLMALPALANVTAVFVDTLLVANNYESIAVAAFALGTLYVTEDTFERVRWTGHQQVLDEIDEAILLLDEDGRVYQYNAAAEELFPSLEATRRFEAILAETASQGADVATPEWIEDGELLICGDGTTTRYYLLRETELTIGPHELGRAVVVSDVTRLERQRRELVRQSEQLEGFGEAIAHELRNSLSIIEGNLQLVVESLETDLTPEQSATIDRVVNATDRMSSVVDDLTTIGRLTQPVTDPQSLPFRTVVREAAETATTADLTLTVDGEGRVRADRVRLVELLCNAVRLAAATDATELSVRLTGDGFVIRTNGDPLLEGDEETLFEYGTAVPHADAGMLGPNLRSLARAHGWDVSAHTPDDGGIAITVSGVRIESDSSHG